MFNKEAATFNMCGSVPCADAHTAYAPGIQRTPIRHRTPDGFRFHVHSSVHHEDLNQV